MLKMYFTQSLILMNTLDGVWEGLPRILDDSLRADFRVLDYLQQKAATEAAAQAAEDELLAAERAEEEAEEAQEAQEEGENGEETGEQEGPYYL